MMIIDDYGTEDGDDGYDGDADGDDDDDDNSTSPCKTVANLLG